MGVKEVRKSTKCLCDSCNKLIFNVNIGITGYEIRRHTVINLTTKQIDAKELYLRNGKIYCSECAFWLNINEIIKQKDTNFIHKTHYIVELVNRMIKKREESLR